MDIDLCGPSVPRMLNIEDKEIHQSNAGWVPVYPYGDSSLAVMSIAFLLKSKNDAIVWRGPKKTAMIGQFIKDVVWSDLDYLVIDTPPGTSDEHMSIVERLSGHPEASALIVTTPQQVAVADVRRQLTFCKKTKVRVLGIIENMSGFQCEHCGECTNIFSFGGGKALAEHFNINFLGCVPLDSNFTKAIEGGKRSNEETEKSSATDAIKDIVEKILLV